MHHAIRLMCNRGDARLKTCLPQVIIDQLNSLGTAEPLVVATLEANMRDGCLSPLIVMLLRMLTSAAIQRRSDFFAPFIMVRRQRPSRVAQQPCFLASRWGSPGCYNVGRLPRLCSKRDRR